ncbi:MAG: hypothetical protein QF570_15005 [Myxococcota bacterium]|nr:hypothetical protein [Myxococcota bacterium]
MSRQHPDEGSNRGAAQLPGRRLAFAFAAAAFLVRLLPFRSVFLEGRGAGVHFTDSDAYYHARRIVYDLAAFPDTLAFDAYLNFPVGAKAIWPQTFDWLIAAILWPFGFADDPGAVARVIVFIPPLLGAATVYALHRIATAHFEPLVAHLAAAVLVLLPAHYWYSQLGFVDHHAAVALCSTALLGMGLRVVRAADGGRVGRRDATGLGVLFAFNLLIWPGALLYLVLGLTVLLWTGVFSRDARTRSGLLDTVWLSCVVAWLGIAPWSLGNDWPQWGPYSAVVLSNFQPWFLAAVGFSSWLALRVDRRRPDAAPSSRVGLALAAAALVITMSFLAIPELASSVRDSSQWLGKGDAFQALVGESVPLFTLHGKFTTAIATSRLSWFVFVFPLAALSLAWRCRSDEGRSTTWAVLFWGMVLFGFTLAQKRFFNTFSVWMALAMALAAAEFSKQHFVPPQHRKLFGAAVCFVFMLPALGFYGGPLRMLGVEAVEANPRIDANRARRELVNWLREHTLETSGYLDANAAPEYGVLARWGEGHFITQGARRPAVMGNFGDDLGRDHFLLARSFFNASPERASEILDELKVRYVVIASAAESRPMARHLFRTDGARLGRYRFVHEIGGISGLQVPAYKVFEFVKGAVLEGRAAPRSLVKVELERTTREGRASVYEEVAETDPQGRYRVRVAHPTRAHPGGVATAERYRVSSAGEEVWVEVLPVAVRDGSVVVIPPFAPSPQAGD